MPIMDINKFVNFKEKPTTFGSVPLPNTSKTRQWERVNKKIFGVANPMRPDQPAQKAIPGKPDKNHIKDSTGNKNNGKAKITTKPPAPPAPPSPISSILPPLALWQQNQYLKELTKWKGTPPETTIEGTPEQITQLKDVISKQPKDVPSTGNGMFGESLKGLGEGLNLATAAIPLLIGVMLLTQIKGLFK